MGVLVTYKNDEVQSKVKALEWSQHDSSIFRHSRAAYSIIDNGILTKVKLIQAFLICKNEEDPFEFESTLLVTILHPLYVYGNFYQTLNGS